MINEIQHGNITTTASRGQGGSRFEPQPKGYGMSQNHHFECPQATFDSSPWDKGKAESKKNSDLLSLGFTKLKRHVLQAQPPNKSIPPIFTTSQVSSTITNLIARLWMLTHETVGVLAAS